MGMQLLQKTQESEKSKKTQIRKLSKESSNQMRRETQFDHGLFLDVFNDLRIAHLRFCGLSFLLSKNKIWVDEQKKLTGVFFLSFFLSLSWGALKVEKMQYKISRMESDFNIFDGLCFLAAADDDDYVQAKVGKSCLSLSLWDEKFMHEGKDKMGGKEKEEARVLN